METNRNKICFSFVLVCFVKPKTKISVCFGVSDLYRNNWKQNCFDTNQRNQNNPKFSEKYQNMPSIKLFRLAFCLFWFNQNFETLCFGVEPKQPKQTVSKQTKTTKTTLNFVKKIPKYALYHTVLVALLFVLVQSKHRNSLFRYWTETTETNVLYRIVKKLVWVQVLVVSNRN